MDDIAVLAAFSSLPLPTYFCVLSKHCVFTEWFLVNFVSAESHSSKCNSEIGTRL